MVSPSSWPKPGPGWGPYGPLCAHIWAHMGLPGQVLEVLEDSVYFPQTFLKDFWTNFARFGSKTELLKKNTDYSASFLQEKLKNHVILTKNFNISPKIRKIPQKFQKIFKNPGFPRVS